MDFALTEIQADLKAAARKYLGDRYPATRIAELADASVFGASGRSFDADAWPELVRQGWLDPDLELVELALLAEESGRALHPTPWWATAGLALPIYCAAEADPPGPATLADGSDTCRAAREGDCWRLAGTVAGVVDARAAAEIVVAARTCGGVAIFGVLPDGPGVTFTERASIDPLRGIADLELANASARLLVGTRSATRLLLATGRRACALLACEAVGVADRALEIAVEYAKARVQFDRPIGSYQAVGHLLADSYAELELARSLAYRAACMLQGRAKNGDTALACAVHASRRAAVQVCEAAMQVCGGIGVTWEFPLHRWYRRALWIDAYHAGRPDPLDTLAEIILG